MYSRWRAGSLVLRSHIAHFSPWLRERKQMLDHRPTIRGTISGAGEGLARATCPSRGGRRPWAGTSGEAIRKGGLVNPFPPPPKRERKWGPEQVGWCMASTGAHELLDPRKEQDFLSCHRTPFRRALASGCSWKNPISKIAWGLGRSYLGAGPGPSSTDDIKNNILTTYSTEKKK